MAKRKKRTDLPKELAPRAEAPISDAHAAIPPRVFWIASLFFFLSGATGLAYQLVWFKRFAHVWGSTSLAFAAVGGSFLFGLGFGAWWIGRRADRVAVPLRWYGLFEIAIGGFALLIPFVIAALVEHSVSLWAAVPEHPLLRYLAQFCVTLLVIGPPCALMGGTLPLLVRQLTPRTGLSADATAALYAINTFGAAAGCYLTGFHLLPALGLSGTNALAAALNVAIGVAAIVASRPLAPAAPALEATRAPERPAPRALYAATLLAGCGALVLEMTWSRQLALVLGGSTYAFTATLFVVLVGIASGSLLYHRWLRAFPETALATAVILVLIATTLLGKWWLPTASLWVASAEIRDLRGAPLGNGVLSVLVSAALELVPAVCMGVLFPLFVRMTQSGAARIGAAVGDVYAWNTLGSIAGASLTAVLLFPWIGTAGAMAFAVACYVAALLLLLPWREAPDLARGGVAALVGAAGVALLAQPLDPRATNSGFYLYGEPSAGAAQAVTPLFFREGASSNVFVSRDDKDYVTLRVNGKIDASSGLDMITQLGSAYLPRIFVPDARDVLVIGFGSGTTPGASLLFPETRVVSWEIEPAVYEARDFFADVNHRPSESARFEIAFGDGRTAIQGSDATWDLIVSEPSNPWLAGVSNLFTREHFRAAREHLRPGGVLAQWVQTYNFTLRDYAMIVRTLRSEFPYTGVLVLAGGADTLLLASERPLLPTPDALARMQALVDGTPALAADLERWFGGRDLRRLLLSHYLLGDAQLAALLERDPSGPLNTDLHLLLEFDAPLHLFRKAAPEDTAALGLLAAMDRRWIDELAAAAGIEPGSADAELVRGDWHWNRVANPTLGPRIDAAAELEAAAKSYERAAALAPDRAEVFEALGRVRSQQGRGVEAIAAWSEAVRLAPTAAAHAALAEELLKQHRVADGVAQLRAALRLQPAITRTNRGAIWANNLAWILATYADPELRDGDEAVRWAEQVVAIDGSGDPATLDTLAAAFAEAGRFDEAIAVANRMAALATEKPELRAVAQQRLDLFRAGQPVRE
jgi:predicted membrane-bound spermidine synthase/tetratricopeptide (TPR) repeat protein